MPDSLKTEILHYAEFLLAKYSNTQKTTEQSEKPHGYGSWAGQIIMSDDFDEPLGGDAAFDAYSIQRVWE